MVEESSNKSNYEKHNKHKDYLEAIKGTHGIYSEVAKRLGITRSSAFTTINSNPNLKQAFEDESERSLDLCEQGAKSIALNSEDDRVRLQAQQFFLKTKGKNRGYTEKTEIEHSNTEPIKINIIMPEDEKSSSE